MPDRIDLVIVTRELKRNAATLKRLVSALSDAPKFTPTGWSAHDGVPLSAFDPAVFIKQLGASKSDEATPVIARNKAVKYEGFFGLRNNGLTSIRMTFGSETSDTAVKDIFALGDRLAAEFHAEYGVAHPVWKSKPKDKYPSYGGSAKFTVDEYEQYGPAAVCARTWFGEHVVGLIGSARLAELGAQETEWGGMQLDLVESPWASDRATLAARQAAVMDALKDSGVFGDYTGFPFYTKGARWS